MLIFAGWVPPDLATSWGCLSLATGIRLNLILKPATRIPFTVIAPLAISRICVLHCLFLPTSFFIFTCFYVQTRGYADSVAPSSRNSENGPPSSSSEGLRLDGADSLPCCTQNTRTDLVAYSPNKGYQLPGDRCGDNLSGFAFCP